MANVSLEDAIDKINGELRKYAPNLIPVFILLLEELMRKKRK